VIRATLLAVFAASLLRGQEAGDVRAFVEQAVPRTNCFVGEVVRVQLRIGYDAEFFARAAIQPFQTRLDLPVRVQVPWLVKPPAGLRLLPSTAGGDAQRVTFALDDGPGEALAAGNRSVDGRTFTVVEWQRRCAIATAGELVLEAPVLRYAYATQFDDDLLNGRVPRDRREAAVRGAELRLQVQPLPVQGRPPEFCGLVGRFAVAASVDRRELAVGETLRLQLRIEGDGDLAACTPPVLAWDGFLVHGPLDDARPGQRTFTWDLVPLREDLREVPAVRLACFDPDPPGYRTVATEAMPLVVRPLPPGASLPVSAGAAGVPGVDDLFDLKPVNSPRGRHEPGAVVVTLALAVPWILALLMLAWVRSRDRLRGDPLGVAARGAHAALTLALARPGSDPAAAFANYVAARLRCPPAAVVGPQLLERLRKAGIAPDLATDAGALLRELGARRYGGDAVEDAQARVRSAADALEAAFLSSEKPA
jgi:hypothetical protein